MPVLGAAVRGCPETAFHPAMDFVERVGDPSARGDDVKRLTRQKRAAHGVYIRANGQDMPEVRDWGWHR